MKDITERAQEMIAMFDGSLTAGGSVDPEVAAAVRDAGKLCESLGHTVEAATLPGDHAAMQAAARLVMSASVVANVVNSASAAALAANSSAASLEFAATSASAAGLVCKAL